MRKNVLVILVVFAVVSALFMDCAYAAAPKTSDETIKIGCGIKHTHTSEFAIVAVGQIQEGVMRAIWPFEYAKNKVLIPAPYK